MNPAVPVSYTHHTTFSDNNVVNTETGVPAVNLYSSSLNLGQLIGNSISGPGSAAIELSGTLGSSGVLPAESYSWVVGVGFIFPDAPTGSSLDVPTGTTLNLSLIHICFGSHLRRTRRAATR